LIFNGHIRTMEEILANFWNLRAVDVLKSRHDFPLQQREKIIEEIIQNCNLKSMVNGTHLSGFSVIKDYNRLVVEVTKLLEGAQKEVYLATRYHDPHFSKLLFAKVASGVTLHMLDGLPDQICVENRLNAEIRSEEDHVSRELYGCGWYCSVLRDNQLFKPRAVHPCDIAL
jgi:hypothetical protein